MSEYIGDPSLTKGRDGLAMWTTNDVIIWLEAIGYQQYTKAFLGNNISGRHLHLLDHQLLKNEIGIDSFGNRVDVLDRVNKLLNIEKERMATKDSNDSTAPNPMTSIEENSHSYRSRIWKKDVVLGEVIGKGGQGTVYKAVWNKMDVVYKKIRINGDHVRGELSNELSVWQYVKFPLLF